MPDFEKLQRETQAYHDNLAKKTISSANTTPLPQIDTNQIITAVVDAINAQPATQINVAPTAVNVDIDSIIAAIKDLLNNKTAAPGIDQSLLVRIEQALQQNANPANVTIDVNNIIDPIKNVLANTESVDQQLLHEIANSLQVILRKMQIPTAQPIVNFDHNLVADKIIDAITLQPNVTAAPAEQINIDINQIIAAVKDLLDAQPGIDPSLLIRIEQALAQNSNTTPVVIPQTNVDVDVDSIITQVRDLLDKQTKLLATHAIDPALLTSIGQALQLIIDQTKIPTDISVENIDYDQITDKIITELNKQFLQESQAPTPITAIPPAANIDIDAIISTIRDALAAQPVIAAPVVDIDYDKITAKIIDGVTLQSVTSKVPAPIPNNQEQLDRIEQALQKINSAPQITPQINLATTQSAEIDFTEMFNNAFEKLNLTQTAGVAIDPCTGKLNSLKNGINFIQLANDITGNDSKNMDALRKELKSCFSSTQTLKMIDQSKIIHLAEREDYDAKLENIPSGPVFIPLRQYVRAQKTNVENINIGLDEIKKLYNTQLDEKLKPTKTQTVANHIRDLHKAIFDNSTDKSAVESYCNKCVYDLSELSNDNIFIATGICTMYNLGETYY